VKPPIPEVSGTGWPRNPVDRFILSKLEASGLTPMPEAGRVTLMRRVTFDLTGLPPSRDAIDRFLADNSPDAYEKLVDRLLASAGYGERWAQHWLDLARFAETDGFEHDRLRPDAWRYRDWVINALNVDMPYDEFVRLQLAGDEIFPGNSAAKIATGFLLCGPDMPDINLQDERRHSFLNDMTATVGSVFLGLQFGCAQCHDHKYDPISQGDFYRLRAFFAPEFQFEKNKIARMRDEPSGEPSHLMVRGDFRRKGPVVRPAFPRIVNYGNHQVGDSKTRTGSSAPRAALARWLTRDDQVLTTRVIVNRLWQHHFGVGLSSTASDFGVMGDPPTHPQLLDWLAAELPGRRWSLKWIHRLLVTSASYRQASRPSDWQWSVEQTARAAASWRKSKTGDPQNKLLSRMSRRRLEGEAIRDAMLAASDSLNRRRSGPGVRPPLPQELLVTLLKNQWPVTPDVNEHDRRSIYLFVRRNLRFPLFDVFDRPDANQSCPRRNRSTIAPQALTQLNSKFSLSSSKRLAGFLLRQGEASPQRQIEFCYLRTLGRRPTADEKQIAADFLARESQQLRQEKRETTCPITLTFTAQRR
jgi:hypothetical protein